MKKNKKVILIVSVAIILIIMVVCLIFCYVGLNKNINNSKLDSSSDINTDISANEVIEGDLKLEVKHAKVPTLMYHSITDDMSYIEYSINAVSPKDFENQLKYISENEYQTSFIPKEYESDIN